MRPDSFERAVPTRQRGSRLDAPRGFDPRWRVPNEAKRVESAGQRYTSGGTSRAGRRSRCELTGSASRYSLLRLRPSARIVADGTAQGSADAAPAERPTIIVCDGDVVAAINARFQTVQRVPLGTVLEASIDDF